MTEPIVEPNSSAQNTTNTLAIVSLVSSLVGFFTAGLGFIAGVVTGHIALSQMKKTREEGRPMALAGLIIGYIGVGLGVLLVAVIIAWFFMLAAGYGWGGYQWHMDAPGRWA